MKKILFVVAPVNFRDEEYIDPKKELEQAGVQVVTASTVKGEIYGKIKIKAESDMLVSEAKVSDYDAVFFTGGPGTSIYFNDANIHNLIREFYNADKIVSAICIAPVILANAGILKGKNATVYPDGESDLKAAGVNYTGKDIEIDGRILTGNGPHCAKEFGQTLLHMIS